VLFLRCLRLPLTYEQVSFVVGSLLFLKLRMTFVTLSWDSRLDDVKTRLTSGHAMVLAAMCHETTRLFQAIANLS
jgi:hypothetical protein